MGGYCAVPGMGGLFCENMPGIRMYCGALFQRGPGKRETSDIIYDGEVIALYQAWEDYLVKICLEKGCSPTIALFRYCMFKLKYSTFQATNDCLMPNSRSTSPCSFRKPSCRSNKINECTPKQQQKQGKSSRYKSIWLRRNLHLSAE